MSVMDPSSFQAARLAGDTLPTTGRFCEGFAARMAALDGHSNAGAGAVDGVGVMGGQKQEALEVTFLDAGVSEVSRPLWGASQNLQ